MSIEIRTKAIAVAKDEAAYIPSWVFHHLHFGFDEIEIITNRTTDNSVEILRKISSKFPQVKHSECDWIDLCGENTRKDLQRIAYAHAYSKSKKEGFTHTLFIDIDEFWTPKNFSTKIKDFIISKDANTSISFQWLCELGLEEEFSSLQQEWAYTLNPHVKTIIHKNSELRKIRIHAPEFTEKSKHILADGTKYIPSEKNPELCHPDTLELKEAFIIHRMYRSEREYISTLARGNPESQSITFKENRDGFARNHAKKIPVEFNNELHSKYKKSLHDFLEKCNLEKEILLAKEETINRSMQSIRLIKEAKTQKPGIIKRIFSGIEIQEVRQEVENLPKEQLPPQETSSEKSKSFESLPLRIRSPMDAGEILREVAISFESCQDYQNAYEAIKIASIFRPNGPVIKNKKSLYESKILEQEKTKLEEPQNSHIKT